MKAFWVILLVPGLLHAQHDHEASTQQKFISGGTIRLHLEAGGYTVTDSDSENITVTCDANTEEQIKSVKVEIKPTGASADVYVSKTPDNNFRATIEVPRHSNLWGRLSAGELRVEGVEGDKNLALRAGRLVIDIPHPAVRSPGGFGHDRQHRGLCL
jgi:hypothetical protein